MAAARCGRLGYAQCWGGCTPRLRLLLSSGEPIAAPQPAVFPCALARGIRCRCRFTRFRQWAGAVLSGVPQVGGGVHAFSTPCSGIGPVSWCTWVRGGGSAALHKYMFWGQRLQQRRCWAPRLHIPGGPRGLRAQWARGGGRGLTRTYESKRKMCICEGEAAHSLLAAGGLPPERRASTPAIALTAAGALIAAQP